MPATTISRLNMLGRWIFAVTSGMGQSSPAEVLHNFIRILEGASPHLRLAIALATPWAMLGAALASHSKVWHTLSVAKTYVTDNIYASVRIPGSHTLQKQVLAYVVEQGLGKNARSLMLSPAQRDIKQLMNSIYDNIYGGARHQKQPRHAEPEENEKPALTYVPQVGTYSFWWRSNRITLRQESREYEERDSRGKYHIVQAAVADIELSCLSLFGGAEPLRAFLKFVQNIPTKERTTTIYRPQGAAWDAGIVQSARNLNAVTLDRAVKDELVRDVETYLQPATKRYYANRGIPYRRGLLFYGPPGTGKTSFANALAGHFGLNVYVLSLATQTLGDAALESLFEQLPNRCIVLLEDIDSAGIQRESMRRQKRNNKKPRRQHYDTCGEPIPPTPPGITLSGLLNVLDGVHSREGMLTIMTSNTPDALDPALVRPGRIDRKVLFSYASAEVAAALFRHIFETTAEETVVGDPLPHQQQQHDIPALARSFADAMPADKLTPADVQGYLLVHRADPVAAVAGAQAWAESTLAIKAKGANVAEFEGAPPPAKKAASGQQTNRGNGGTTNTTAAPDNEEDEDESEAPLQRQQQQQQQQQQQRHISMRGRPYHGYGAYPAAPPAYAFTPTTHGLPTPSSAYAGLPDPTMPQGFPPPSSAYTRRPAMPRAMMMTTLLDERSGVLPQQVQGQQLTPPLSRSVSRLGAEVKEEGGEEEE